MIKAINNYVIVEETKEDNVTSTGILVSNGKDKITYKVVATTEQTEQLQDKQVYIKDFTRDHIKEQSLLKDNLYAIHIDNIIAWE